MDAKPGIGIHSQRVLIFLTFVLVGTDMWVPTKRWQRRRLGSLAFALLVRTIRELLICYVHAHFG